MVDVNEIETTLENPYTDSQKKEQQYTGVFSMLAILFWLYCLETQVAGVSVVSTSPFQSLTLEILEQEFIWVILSAGAAAGLTEWYCGYHTALKQVRDDLSYSLFGVIARQMFKVIVSSILWSICVGLVLMVFVSTENLLVWVVVLTPLPFYIGFRKRYATVQKDRSRAHRKYNQLVYQINGLDNEAAQRRLGEDLQSKSPDEFSTVDNAYRSLKTLETKVRKTKKSKLPSLSTGSSRPNSNSEVAKVLRTHDTSKVGMGWRNGAKFGNALGNAIREDAQKNSQKARSGKKSTRWWESMLFEYSWEEFEELVGELYRANGYQVTVTQGVNDKGVDVWARKGSEVVAVQVKQYNRQTSVGRPELQRITSMLATGDATKVAVVTSSSFSSAANEYSGELGEKMKLIDGDELVRLLSSAGVDPPR